MKSTPISPITEETSTNTSLKEITPLNTASEKKAAEVSNELLILEKKIDEKITPKRRPFPTKPTEKLEFDVDSTGILKVSSSKILLDDKQLIKAAVELDEDNKILNPDTCIVNDFVISEKMEQFKSDTNARFFSYEAVKDIDNSFEVPDSSFYCKNNSPAKYINSISDANSNIEESEDEHNMTMIENATNAIGTNVNISQITNDEKKVTFADDLVEIDDISKRDEVYAVHDYYYYSDDEQTVFHASDDEVSLDGDSRSNNEKNQNISLDLSYTQDSDMYDPIHLLENRDYFNSSFSSTKTAFEIGTQTPAKIEKQTSKVDDYYKNLKEEMINIKKNQESLVEMMKKMFETNKKIYDETCKSNQQVIDTLKQKIFELESELESADKEIIDCCNRATYYRRIYLELAVEGNKITVSDAVGQMNDPKYNEEYFEKYQKKSETDIVRALSSIDMTNKRISIEKIDKNSSKSSTLQKISSILSPRKKVTRCNSMKN
uniref:Fibronectin type-III domain-containing protein n=1 Tax=Parastrongyloides trichosuri TaxID=131310 RepID=A0A0N4ZX63_PARTI